MVNGIRAPSTKTGLLLLTLEEDRPRRQGLTAVADIARPTRAVIQTTVFFMTMKYSSRLS